MRFEMIENFSVTFSSLKFFFCMAAIISAPTPFKRLCNFALYFSCRKSAGGTTKIFIPTLVQRKKCAWLCAENLPLHFFSRKTVWLTTWKTKNLQNVQKIWRNKKQAEDCKNPLPVAVYIFRNRNRIVRSRFRLFFCYGSNSGVGSYTSIIRRAANRNPIVNACNSCLSETIASAFSSCSSRAFCCSVRVALSSVSSRTTISSNSPLSVPFETVCSCGSMLP